MTPPDAKVAMMEAAERLVAERGVANFSLRQVQKAAGQRNKSAATYHFGTKEGLLAAILEYRMGPINDLRATQIKVLIAEQTVSITSLVRVLVDPLAANTVGTPGSGYARFLARTDADPAFLPVARAAGVSRSYRNWRRLIGECLTHLPPPLRAVRIDRTVDIVIHSLALWEDGRGKRGQSLEILLDDLVQTCVAMLQAPLPPTSSYESSHSSGNSDTRPSEFSGV